MINKYNKQQNLFGIYKETIDGLLRKHLTMETIFLVKNAIYHKIYYKYGQHFTDFDVICDETTNTSESVIEGIINVKIFIKELYSNEDVEFRFGTTSFVANCLDKKS